LEVAHTDPALWVKYAEMEMRGRFIAHARNVWDRAVTLLPRVDQLWYKYVHMEEVLGDIPAARAVFDRWMAFEPDHYAWASFLKFETRYADWEAARSVCERYVLCHPTILAYTRYAKFEASRGRLAAARAMYERAVADLDPAALEDGGGELYLSFAAFEGGPAGEPARARAIYRYALDHVPKASALPIFEALSAFERAHGDRAGVDSVVAGEARFAYEEALKANPLSYDTWFEYGRLEEGAASTAASGPAGRSPANPAWTAAAGRVREVYERAVANLPPCGDGVSAGLDPAAAKRLWSRYLYLWLRYAVWEELGAGDLARARAVHKAALAIIPHRVFTFGKLWVAAAHAAVRGRDLPSARKLLGTAIGMCPKASVFRAYIALELALGAIDRARTLHTKWAEWAPHSAEAWTAFADLEAGLGEAARARSIFELGVGQPALDAPDAVWKAYIAFEVGMRERGRARALYERLLDRTRHVKVWLAYAAFEAGRLPAPPLEDGEGEDTPAAAAARADAADAADPAEGLAARAAAARGVYERAYRFLREDAPELKEEAVAVLGAWRGAETAVGEAGRAAAVAAKLPRRVKRKRPAPDGVGAAMEEYYDYVFPDEGGGGDGGGGGGAGGGGSAAALRLLEAAQAWKKKKVEREEA